MADGILNSNVPPDKVTFSFISLESAVASSVVRFLPTRRSLMYGRLILPWRSSPLTPGFRPLSSVLGKGLSGPCPYNIYARRNLKD